MSAHGPVAIVVVPARDEEERIGACLAALAAQTGVAACSFEIVLVLDGCRDETGARARAAMPPGSPRLHVVEPASAIGVGGARRLGMGIACEHLLAAGRPDGLIASTDADSVPALDWLAAQLALVARGAQAIGGDIELDPGEASALPAATLDWRTAAAAVRLAQVRDGLPATVLAHTEHHHFSGASLGITAAAYARCGGLPARAALEDEALAGALDRHAIPIHRSRAVRVRTSARTDGRAPRGLSRDLTRAGWHARRHFRSEEFQLERLLAAKRDTITVILPTREVAETIEPIAAAVARFEAAGLIDEAIVVDAASADGTAEHAAALGVRVEQENDLAAAYGPVLGKGDALWRGLSIARGDIVAFLDTDTQDFDPAFVTGLLGPLLCHDSIEFVKAAYARPFRCGDIRLAAEGGRVTELVARPLLNLYAPDLAVFAQPLAGEFAGRRALLERLPFSAGYGVEIGLLIDAWRDVGLDRLAQVDLGQRQNRHQPLRDLSAMAYAVLVAATRRFHGAEFADAHAPGSILLPDGAGMGLRAVPVEERPPLSSVRQQCA